MSSSLFIDGENLRHYIEDVLEQNGHKSKKINDVNLPKLLNNVLKGIDVKKRIFYSAKLHIYREYSRYLEKSKDLILKQRVLKTSLEKNGYEFIISGHVRAFKVRVNGKEAVIFKEKGVDVKIAVDLVSNACDKKGSTVVLCSSDSDLQPAIKEARFRGLEIIYLGFEINPNKGLMYTCNRSIIIRNFEVMESLMEGKI